MDVYVEITYILNAILILLTFELLCFLLNQHMTLKEMMKYMLLYNLSFLLLYVDVFPGFFIVYTFIISLILFRKLIYIYYPIFLFVYVSLVSFLEILLPSTIIFKGILLVEKMNISSFLIIILLGITGCYFYILFCQNKIQTTDYVKVCIKGKNYRGFIDTGNQVYYKGYPVIFVNQHMIQDECIIDTIEIETATQIENVDIILLDRIQIKNMVLRNIYVGIMNNECFDCILNKDILGGRL